MRLIYKSTNYKTIKKLYKIAFIAGLVILVALPVGGFIILHSSNVQTFLIEKITRSVSENLGADITIKKVDFRPFNRLILNEVFVKDQMQDTLLVADKLTLGFVSLSPREKTVILSTINIDDGNIQFRQDSSNNINIKFIVDRLERKDTTKTPWQLYFNKIALNNSKFSYEINKETDNKKSDGNTFDVLRFDNLNINLRNFKVIEGTTSFFIKNLTCDITDNLRINQLNSEFVVTSQMLKFEELYYETKHSFMDAELLSLDFESFKTSWQSENFISDVHINFLLNETRINTKEISDLLPILRDYDKDVKISGAFKGFINDINVKNFLLEYGGHTSLSSNFSLNGLPDINNTFIFHDIKSFTTSAEDIKNININHFTKKNVTIPSFLKQLGQINYKGNFTGFLDDFVAYGTLHSDMGVVFTDISIKPDTLKNIHFKGKLKTHNFRVGSLLSPENHTILDKISININTNGTISADKEIYALTKGKVNSFDLNKYTYNNITINGALTNKTYDGTLVVDDPNINLKFLGKFNFEHELPEFDFMMDVNDAQVNKLNIVEDTDSTTNVSFGLTAKLTGKEIDNIYGNIMLRNLDISNRDDDLFINNLALIADTAMGEERLKLTSDYIDGSITGDYSYETFIPAIKHYLSNYLPAFSDSTKQYTASDNLNDFEYNIHIKQSKPVTFFFPDFDVSDNAYITGYFGHKKEHVKLNITAQNLLYKQQRFDKLKLNAYTDTSGLKFLLNTGQWMLNEHIVFDNFSIRSNANNNKIDFSSKWFNNDSSLNKGNIKASASFISTQHRKTPLIHLEVFPSSVTYNDTTWNISKSSIFFDTTKINVSELAIEHKKQHYIIDGIISENDEDQLFLYFKNLNLQNYNLFTQQAGLTSAGILNGKAVLSGLYKNPNFFTDLNIDTLVINDEQIGMTTINTSWNNDKKHIKIDAHSKRGKLKTLDIQGNYVPNTKDINLTADLNKLRLNILNPFLEGILTDIKGISTGNLTITGPADNINLNGSFTIQKSSFTIDYLQTRYSFTHKLNIKNNNILFDGLQLHDRYGNITGINGSIRFIGEPEVDLVLNADNSFLLNTEEADNEDFFGSAFLTGIINLKNTDNKFTINASGKTNENTRVFIPVGSGKEIQQMDYINFINQDVSNINDQAVKEDDYKVDLSGFFMDFDLKVTPDATVQLIMNEQTGEIIEATGNGNINMAITKTGDFEMIGNYTIEQGSYLFTLQNIISKRFSIEQGSSINWTGDPYNAEMDITAIYNTRASLGELFADTTSLYSKRIPVECQILLTDKLIAPNIQLAIHLPNASPEAQNRVDALLNNENKISTQFLSLLILNKFLPDQDMVGGRPWMDAGSSHGLGASGAVTASELLSSQLSNMLSQISNDIDIGVNYRPGDEKTTDEMEVAMSTQLLNDRVSISGNIDMGGKRTTTSNNNTSDIVGDFNVEVKLNESGKLRLKAFNKTTDELMYEKAPYKQGVGILIREDFNTFDQLIKSYWRRIFGKNKKKK